MRRYTRRGWLAAGVATLAGCAGVGGRSTRSAQSAAPPPTAGPDAHAFTHLHPDGNRVVDGRGRLPVEPVDVPVEGTPAWVLGVGRGPVRWVVVREDGRVTAFTLADGERGSVPVTPSRLPEGMPPVATNDGEGIRLLAPLASASTRTHPFPLGSGRSLAVGASGDLLLMAEHGVTDRLALDCPRDARVVRAGDRYAVLAGATTRYDHGALGDAVEASGFALVDADGGLSVASRVSLPRSVIEGVAPLAGFGGLVVTETDAERGARAVLYDGTERVATGPAIGQGYRWRHQLAVAPFAPDGVPELAVVRTPHIGGSVEFYRREGDRLCIAATLEGASSHAYGSRNLDGAVAGDLDGDGRVELLVPDDARERLRAVRRTSEGARGAWLLPVGGDLTTNVHAVRTGGGVAVAAGREGAVRVWR